MKRFLVNSTAILAFSGCGGSQEGGGSVAPKQALTNVPSPSVATVAAPSEAKSATSNPLPASKKAAEAPGLVLPDDDADVVGRKGPDLPIR